MENSEQKKQAAIRRAKELLGYLRPRKYESEISHSSAAGALWTVIRHNSLKPTDIGSTSDELEDFGIF